MRTALRRSGILLALAAVLAACQPSPAPGGGGGGSDSPDPDPPPAPAMPDDPAIVALVEDLAPGEGVWLPAFRVEAPLGGLEAHDTFATEGPGVRDYSMKWVWAADRGSGLYAGANHGQPHKFDDVWEFFLGANAWVLRYPPDPEPVRPLHTWWSLAYDDRAGRLYWMAPQTAVSTWPLVEAQPDPPLVYFEPAHPEAGWRYLPTSPEVRPGLGSAMAYLPDRGALVLWAPSWQGSGLQLLDLDTGAWQELLSHDAAYHDLAAVSPRADAIVNYDPARGLLVGFMERDVFVYRFADNTWTKALPEGLPVPVNDHVAGSTYLPSAGVHLISAGGRLLAYDPAENAVRDVTPDGYPDGTRETMLYADARLDRVVVYEDGNPRVFVYRYGP